MSDLAKYSIGWKIGSKYQKQIGICVDEKLFGTIWTNHLLHGANIEFQDKDPNRPHFQTDGFFQWTTQTKMEGYYKKSAQMKQLKKLLRTGNKIDGKKLIDVKSGEHYFAKVTLRE